MLISPYCIYDSAGRRVAKNYDEITVVKYLAACPELGERDGDHCIAEYDGEDQLLRQYIYGPGVDPGIDYR
ncbi:MAG: hypothetical protein JW741_08265 [Sedimentisphaerales bacterium]|nr:hypothetical protein [Sedimentisphaerales bacterium]